MKNKTKQKEIIEYIKNNTETKDLYWYPMTELKTKLPVKAYYINQIYEDNNIKLLEKIFKRMRAKYVETFCMDNNEYFEKDVIYELIYEKDNNNNYIFPRYVETFYFDKSNKWMIYVSHEGTITFTGKKIVNTANKIIPKKYLYKKEERID